MKILYPWACDQCKKMKTEGEQWFLGLTTNEAIRNLFSYLGRQADNVVMIVPWGSTTELHDVHEHKDVAHLCSTPCATSTRAA